jgi:hypothetical protein
MQFVPFVTYFVIFQSLLALALSGCKVINKIIDNCFFFKFFFAIYSRTYVRFTLKLFRDKSLVANHINVINKILVESNLPLCNTVHIIYR